MPFAQLPDVRIHYQWAGPEHAPVLVLSHALGTNHRMWDAQLADFTQHFRVLLYDTRGHGDSRVPPGPYSNDQLGRDVVQLLDLLGLQRASFCGLSMGGMLGIYLGSQAPERLRKLVLSNTASKFGTPEIWNARIDAVRKGGMKAVTSGIIERWFTAGFRASNPSEVGAIQRMLEQMDASAYEAACAAIRDVDQRAALSRVRTPALVISGTHDAGTPPTEGRFIAEKIPGAKYVELKAAHLSNIEARADFNREVMAFLRS